MSIIDLSVQLDTAVFPSHSLHDISSTVVSADVDLGVDIDNGAAAVRLTAMPASAALNVRLYIYISSVLIFNGFVVDLVRNADRTVSLLCTDYMARLRNPWSKDDRTYTSATEGSVVQNLVEASGIDVSLTHIEDALWTIGVSQDVVLHGGTPDLITGAQGTCDVPLDLIRKIDEATPLYVTYAAGNGAVYRRQWTDRTSVATFADGTGGNLWDLEVRGPLTTIRNACKVIGLTIADVPTTSLYQATNPLIDDPPKYITHTVTTSLIEDGTQADAVTLAYVTEENAVKHTAVWLAAIRNDIDPADTLTLSSSDYSITSQAVRVVHLHHHIDGQTATTQLTAAYRS